MYTLGIHEIFLHRFFTNPHIMGICETPTSIIMWFPHHSQGKEGARKPNVNESQVMCTFLKRKEKRHHIKCSHKYSRYLLLTEGFGPLFFFSAFSFSSSSMFSLSIKVIKVLHLLCSSWVTNINLQGKFVFSIYKFSWLVLIHRMLCYNIKLHTPDKILKSKRLIFIYNPCYKDKKFCKYFDFMKAILLCSFHKPFFHLIIKMVKMNIS